MATYKGEEINLTPTATMAEEAQRGLDWRRKHGRGGTAVGVARARQIVNREELSPRTVRRMVSFFARHEVDKQAEGFSPGEDGYPSAGRIAWALWGGDAGKAWADEKDRVMDKIDERADVDDLEERAPTPITGAVKKGLQKKSMTITKNMVIKRASTSRCGCCPPFSVVVWGHTKRIPVR